MVVIGAETASIKPAGDIPVADGLVAGGGIDEADGTAGVYAGEGPGEAAE